MQPNTALPVDQVVIETSPLALPLPDATLLAVMNDAEARAGTLYASKHLSDRSQGNRKFWLGEQVDESRLDSRYQMAHVDNVSFQNLENQIKLASGKMPDIFVAPPDREDYNMEAARDLQQWLRERIDSNTMKRLIKNGLRKMNLDLIAVIKPRWDYSRADFVFEMIDAKDIRFSEGSKIPEDGFTADGCDMIFQYVEEPTQVILAKFKKKEQQLIQEIGRISNTTTQLPARLRYTEVHFRWFDDRGRLNEGVAWRYGNVILDAMKEPYFDYNNPEINYFDRPRKPYIIFSYLNLGDSMYEATTTFEQSKSLNRIVNKRRRQITEISDRAVPKLAFSGHALTKEQAREISPSPNEGIFLNKIEDIRKAMTVIPATKPDPILFNDLVDLRGRLDSMFATHGTTRGETNSASGVSKQISREGDLVTSDDIVDVVVERVVSEMVAWSMQFARLFYDDDRPALRSVNEANDVTHIKLDRKKIETDILAIVKASTNDKATRRNDALQMLTGKVTDPYTLFEDLDVPNPKERTRRLLTFIMAQSTNDWPRYLQTIGVDIDINKADEADAKRDIEALLTGNQPPVTKDPSESYVSTFMAFIQSPEFQQLPQEVQARVKAHIQQLKQNVERRIGEKEAGQPSQPQDPNAPPADPNQQPGQQQPGGSAGAAPQPSQPGYAPAVDVSTVFAPQAGQQAPPGAAEALQARMQFPVTQAVSAVTRGR